MAAKIITRAEAQAQGLARYFTNKPCKRGHITNRIAVNGTCVQCHSNLLTRYKAENKDRVRETDRLHRLANYQKHRSNNRNWRLKNIEVVRTKDRIRYAQGDRELHRKHRRDRRARLKNASGSHTIKEIVDLLHRQKWRCAGCGISIKEKRELDHIKALARGGSNDITNLQWLCPDCNHSKHAKDPFVWAQENGRLL